MVSDNTSGSDLGWLLEDLVGRVPYTRAAVLLSSDGIKRAVHGLDVEGADHLSAVASGLWSIVRSAGKHFGDGPQARQVVAELDGALLFVTAAGRGSVLAVLAGPEADPGVIGFEMSRMIQQVAKALETPARNAASATP
jgi:predicted regulator of Ras-like GTPase activity (Roadblock/LC7/MglB family)